MFASYSKVPMTRPLVIGHLVLSDVPCRTREADRVSQSEELNSTETALAYMENKDR